MNISNFISCAQETALRVWNRKLGCKWVRLEMLQSPHPVPPHRILSAISRPSAIITWIKGFQRAAAAAAEPSLFPAANIHHLTFCLSSPWCFSDLIQATQETNVNVPQMADTLMERVGNASWVVVFKALITTHHLMVNGNEVRLQRAVITRALSAYGGCWFRCPGKYSRGKWVSI